jgi:hypothetical protein
VVIIAAHVITLVNDPEAASSIPREIMIAVIAGKLDPIAVAIDTNIIDLTCGRKYAPIRRMSSPSAY